MESDKLADRQVRINKLVTRLLVVAIAMFVFPFASIPLYRAFCQWTGLNGKVPLTAAESAQRAGTTEQARLVTVEFMADADPGLPWTLKPETSQIKVHVGESHRMNFYAENYSDQAVVARAVPSISPGEGAAHFKKTQCFCFDAINLAAHEKLEMPVVFYLDDGFPREVSTVTLAYKVFNVTDQVNVIKAKPAAIKAETSIN